MYKSSQVVGLRECNSDNMSPGRLWAQQKNVEIKRSIASNIVYNALFLFLRLVDNF